MAGSTKVVGRVSVKVYPDTKDFKDKLERDLRKAEKDKRNQLNLSVKLDERALERDAISKLRDLNRKLKAEDRYKVKFRAAIDETGMEPAIRTARKQLQRHATEYTKATPIKFKGEMEVADTQVDLDTDSMKKVEKQLKDWISDISPMTVLIKPELRNVSRYVVEERLDVLARNRDTLITPRINESAAARVGTILAALSGGRASYDITTNAWDTIKELDKVAPRIAAVTNGLTNLAAFALTATSNTLSLGSSLAAIGPALLTMPGLFGGMAVGTGVMVAALKDFNTELPIVGTQLNQMQDTISSSFWSQAKNPMSKFFTDLMPQFTNNVGETGAALGKFFGSLADSSYGIFDGGIQGMFADLNKSIDISTGHTDSFVGIIDTLGRTGASRLPELAGWFGDMADDFDTFLATADADGRLDGWIERGKSNLQSLGSVLHDTGSIFSALADAAERAGGSTLDTLASTVERIDKKVSSAGFQTGMTKTFRAAHEAIDGITSQAGPELEGLMARLSDDFTSVLPSAGRAGGKALGAIFDALDQDRVSSSLRSLFSDIETSVDNLAPAMKPTAAALAAIAETVGTLAVNVSRILGPALENLAPKIESIADEVGVTADALGKILGPAIDVTSHALSFLPNDVLLATGAFLAWQKANGNLGGSLKTLGGQVKTNGGLIRSFSSDWKKLGANYDNVTRSTQQLKGGYKSLMFTDPTGFLRNTENGLGRAAVQTNRMRKSTYQLKGVMSATSETGRRLGQTFKTFGKAGGIAGGAAIAAGALGDNFALTNTAMFGMIGTIGGPLGAAAGAAIGFIKDIGAQAQKNSQYIDGFNDSLAAGDIAAMGQNYEAARKQLQSMQEDSQNVSGALDFLGDAWSGVNIIVGNNGFDTVGDGIDTSADKLTNLTNVLSGVTSEYGEFIRSYSDGASNFDFGNFEDLARVGTQLAPTLSALGISMEQLGNASDPEEQARLSQEIIDYISHAQTAKGRTEQLGEAFLGLKGKAVDTAAAADALSAALKAALSPQLTAEQATIAWQRALQDFDEAIKSKAGLQGFTENAMANKEAIIGAVSSLQDMIVANAEAGQGAGQLANQLKRGKDAIIEQAHAAGLSKKEVRAYLNTLGLTPDRISTILETVGVTRETARIKKLREQMGDLPKKLQTKIETAGYPITKAQLKDLVARYEKNPKKVTTEIIAIVKDAKRNLDSAKGSMDVLDKKTVNPKVLLDDKASKPAAQIDSKLTSLDGAFATPTVGLTDRASQVLSAIKTKLDNLAGRVVTTTVVTNYRTNGGGGRGGGGGNDPFTGKAIAGAARGIQTLSDALRKQLIRASDGWVRNVRGNATKIDNAILQSVTQAQNKVDNLKRKVSGAANKEAKAAAKKELAQAEKQLASIKAMSKGWKAQAKEIDAAIRRYDRVNSQLDSAVAKLDSVNQQVASFKESLKDSYIDGASILSSPLASFSSMEKYLTGSIKDLTALHDGLDALTGMGLSQTIVDQLAQEGPEALDFIKSILGEGQAGVDRLNDLWGQVEHLSGSTANLVGDYVYADEIEKAKNAVDALLATLKDLKAPIESASNALLGSISKGAKANRKKITGELDRIIRKYRELLKLANKATDKDTAGLLARPVAVARASRSTTTSNDNRTFNININTQTQAGTDLFAAARSVKAVIATA